MTATAKTVWHDTVFDLVLLSRSIDATLWWMESCREPRLMRVHPVARLADMKWLPDLVDPEWHQVDVVPQTGLIFARLIQLGATPWIRPAWPLDRESQFRWWRSRIRSDGWTEQARE